MSKELVIAFVGYAGAGCSTAAKRLQVYLEQNQYEVKVIKLSKLIEKFCDTVTNVATDRRIEMGKTRFQRACKLQDLGDSVRKKYGNQAIATLAIKENIHLRGGKNVGEQKVAFLLDSIKHFQEVELFRRVYDKSFRLIAIHCERPKREGRIIGDEASEAKYAGAIKDDVIRHMERDEKDDVRHYGQQVREAFYQADFFIDNNVVSSTGENLNEDLNRFVNLARSIQERAMM